MLHRAATSAYSWWWASHIRTKQSKWLEQNLQDMEEKVQSTLKIIEQEGDSFAKRAEMYYKKRPELINLVEDSYRAYRALAERFDHLSKDLQSANRTIATVFPEQVQLALESDDDDSLMGSTAPSPDSDRLSTKNMASIPKNLPKAPKLPTQNLKGQSILASKREQLRKNFTSKTLPITSTSGLSKEEACKEINNLEKEILSMQTEKEFVKSAYETAMGKFLELENKITESQTKVCGLQDEFGIGSVMEDHEARTLMASSALDSCEEALAKLQKEQERSMEVVNEEYERIKEAHERLESLKKLQGHEGQGSDIGSKNFEEKLKNVDELREIIREQLKLSSNSSLTESEMVDKVDELVEKIVSLETSVCSLNALVERLKQEIDELLRHIKSLEEQKSSLVESSAMNGKLRELEEELTQVKSLNKQVVDQKNTINAEITEASCKLDHLKERLHDVKPVEEVKVEQEVETKHEEIENEIEKESFDSFSEPHREMKEEENMSRTTESTFDSPDLQLKEEDGLNWRQLYLNNMEDREKILVEEYTIILRDYKDVKTKLNELEKKHRDNIVELTSHVRELRNIISSKEEEIQNLQKKLNGDEKIDSGLEENEDLKQEEENESKKQPLFHHLYDRDSIIKETSPIKKEGGEKRVTISAIVKSRPVSRTEAKFRAELDNLLEANLDFWLRFSTSFHQIQKFQTSIKDLQAELAKLKESQKQGQQQSIKSDARPLYKHLREIETELTLWLEHSAVFQEELRSRFSSLNSIQDEITSVSNVNHKEEKELSDYQSAKFQGEVVNMKQENSKVAEELQGGAHRVKALKVEVRKALEKLDKEFGFSESKSRSSSIKNPSNKPRIPLHSFLFGMKIKKHKQKPPSPSPSLFACVNPTLNRQDSILPELQE